MASIKKRGPNTYQITVSNGYNREGMKIAEYKTVSLDPDTTAKQQEKEIKRLAAKFEEEVKCGKHINSKLTFEQFTFQWLIDYGKNRLEMTTIESYKRELENKILPAIGHVKLEEIKPLHLIRFYEQLKEDGIRIDGKPGGYSTRIIKYQHSIISTILQTAVYWQILHENVARRVQPPKGEDREKRDNYLDETMTRDLLRYISETEPLVYQAMAFVTAYGGLRKGELLGLYWSDISFTDGTVAISKAYTRSNKEEFIKEPKNKSSNRVIVMPTVVMKLLKELKLSSSNIRVFPLSYGVPTQWFKRVLNRYNASRNEKLPSGMTYHGLRHTSASLLIAQGLDVRSVAARLGHADMATTMKTYAHAIKSRDKAVAEMLDNAIGIEL